MSEEPDDPTIRAFDVLFLDDSTLVTRLASTRYRDDESGRMVTVSPDDDYFLVWAKGGARKARGAAAAAAAPAAEAEDAPPGGLFGSFGTALVRRGGGVSLATIAEREAKRGERADGRAAGRQAAVAARKQEAADRKATAAAERARVLAEKQQVCARSQVALQPHSGIH